MLIILMTTVTSVVFKILGSPECSTPHDNVWGQGRKKQLVKTYFTITARHSAFGAETEALCSSLTDRVLARVGASPGEVLLTCQAAS